MQNLKHFTVVLGCAIHKGQPSPDLKQRLDLALKIACTRPTTIISSGLGHQQEPESAVMQRYLQNHSKQLTGLNFLQQPYSLNTAQNAYFTLHLIYQLSKQFTEFNHIVLKVVTSNYHVERSRLFFTKMVVAIRQRYPQVVIDLQELAASDSHRDADFRESQQLFDSVDSMTQRLLEMKFNLRIFKSMRGMTDQHVESLLEFSKKDPSILKKYNWD